MLLQLLDDLNGTIYWDKTTERFVIWSQFNECFMPVPEELKDHLELKMFLDELRDHEFKLQFVGGVERFRIVDFQGNPGRFKRDQMGRWCRYAFAQMLEEYRGLHIKSHH